jgi:hypothetical protein
MSDQVLLMKELGPALRKHQAAVASAINKGVIAGARAGRAVLVKATPTDQGQLRNSWKVSRARASGQAFADVELINEAPHAGIVERGARPHKVSAAGWAAIYAWVVRHRKAFGFKTKSGRAKAHKPTRGDVRTRTDIDPALASITWAIVKHIEKYGQKPTYFVRNQVDPITLLTQGEVERRLREVAAGKGQP